MQGVRCQAGKAEVIADAKSGAAKTESLGRWQAVAMQATLIR